MTDPENPADGDSSASGSKSKQRLLTRVLTVPGILATTTLTAAVSWVVSLGLTQLSAAASSPQDAVAVSVEADPTLISGSSNAGRTVVFPATTKTTGDPGVGGCDGFHKWSVANGGVDADFSTVEVIVQGKRDGAVLLDSMRTKILSKSAPIKGILAECPTAGTAQRREIQVDLDSPNSATTYKAAGVASPFGFTLAKGETETFVITARTTRASYDWIIELNLVVDGKPVTISVGPPGGFHTSATKPHSARWQWNFQDSWSAFRPDGTSASPEKIPAGAPLVPVA